MDKSYVENAYKNGIFTLPIQIKPISSKEFTTTVKHSKIVAYGFSGVLPICRILQSASNFLLYFNNGKVVEFRGLATMVKDSWDEYGSLKIIVHESIDDVLHGDLPIDRFNVEATSITSIEKLIYQDDEMLIECGIVFNANTNQEIQIVVEYGIDLIIQAFFTADSPVIFAHDRALKVVPF